jgi:hypothetical protein
MLAIELMIKCRDGLRKMECALALHDCYPELLAQNVNVAVIRHLEIVDTCHDRREVVIRRVRGLAGLAHDGKHGGEVLEAWSSLVACNTYDNTALLTSDGKLRATSDELQKLPTLLGSVFTHSMKQVPHALAIEVEAVIRLDGIHKSCVVVSNVPNKILPATYFQGTNLRRSCQTTLQVRQA